MSVPPAALHVHATAIAAGGDAVLIRGPSGSGKSDLALRCLALPDGPITGPAMLLVADDQVVLSHGPAGLMVSAPAAIAGKLEVRGIGIVEMAGLVSARLRLVVDLVPPDAVERMPEPMHCLIAGVRLPLLQIAPFEASAPLKVRLCLRRVIEQNP